MKVESIWIPYIIFKNTDTDEAVTLETPTLVSVTRQGNFTGSGAEVPDEVIAMFENKKSCSGNNYLLLD